MSGPVDLIVQTSARDVLTLSPVAHAPREKAFSTKTGLSPT